MIESLSRTASMAAIPQRESILEKAIGSILPQVDRMNVYLNNWDHVPSFLESNPKISVARSQEYGDRGDAGKFFWAGEITGYHFTTDDDLLYADDYIETLVRKIEQYGRRCAVGLHGGSFVRPIPLRSFFNDRVGIHTFATYVEKDTFVNVLGTGVLGYHSSTLKVRPKDFERPNMADLWFAVISKKQGIPQIVIQRDKQLAAPLISVQDDKGCLYDRFIRNDRFHTETVNDCGPWPVLTLNVSDSGDNASRAAWTKNPDNRIGYFHTSDQKRPKIGLILRCDTGGLANISQEFYIHLAPHKSLVLDLFKDRVNISFPERFIGKNVTLLDHVPTDAELAAWIDGLDVVMAFETPYNWSLFELCRARGIKTVLMVDYEWLPDPLPSRPDVLWQPANWYLDELKATGVETVFMPMPVNRARYPFKLRTKAETILCNFGRHNSSTPNRDCKIEIFTAIQLIKNQELRFIIRANQPFLPLPGFPQELIDSVLKDPRVTVDFTVKENPADNYAEGDIYLHPKTYNGMALTMNEALSCGMPVIMVDHFPQNRFLPSEWLIKPDKIAPIKLSRTIDLTRIDPRDIAAKIEWMTSGEFNMERESEIAGALAESISWKSSASFFNNLPDSRKSPETPPMMDAPVIPNAHSAEACVIKKKLRILFVGHFHSTWSTETYHALALESLGHEVIRLQGNLLKFDSLLDHAKNCDLFMYSPAFPLAEENGRGGLWLLDQLKAEGIVTASYHNDVHICLHGRDEATNLQNPFWAHDFVFTADGGHQKEFQARGINHIHLSPGVPEHECYEGTPRPEFEADVAFVGTCFFGYHTAQWPFRERLLNWLVDTYGSRFKMFGPGSRSPFQMVRNQELNDLYASVKIVVGDSMIADSGTETPNSYWSNRLFEVPGRGGFLIFPKPYRIERFLTPGKHVVFYEYDHGRMTDFSKLKQTIDYYLEHDEEREKIRKAGHLHVKQTHTERHRMAYMLNLIAPQVEASIEARRIKNMPHRLCVGSGVAPELGPDWTNLDIVDFGNNVVHNLEETPWPFPDNHFIEIKAVDVLEHLDNIVPAINEIIRITKPGGKVFVQVPNAKYPCYVWTDPEHKRGFAEKTFDYWQPDKPLCKSFGRSKNKDRFYIKNLSVRELNLNLVFEFEKA